jgi:hypothetical protein
MKQELTPLEVCKRLIGPLGVIAEIIGYGPTAPYLWEKPAQNRAAGDLPSANIMRQLLDHSEANSLGLTASHLVRGAPEDEIAQILADREAADRDPPFVSRRTIRARSAAA